MLSLKLKYACLQERFDKSFELPIRLRIIRFNLPLLIPSLCQAAHKTILFNLIRKG